MPSSITRDRTADNYRLHSIGKLKKGTPKIKGGYGNNLDYFRFETNSPFFRDEFDRAYGPRPSKIHVILPYRTAAMNFDDWHMEYGSSRAGDWYVKRRCDGKTISQWMPPGESDYSFEEKPCEKACGCKCSLTGLLSVYIREPEGEWWLPGFNQGPVTVETHSKNDVDHIMDQLRHFERELAGVGANLAGARFIIERQLDKFGIPLFDKGTKQKIPGRRAIKEDWLIKIYPEPEWHKKVMKKQMEVMFAPIVLPVAEPLQLEPSWAEPLDLKPKPEREAELLPAMTTQTAAPRTLDVPPAPKNQPTPKPASAPPTTQNAKPTPKPAPAPLTTSRPSSPSPQPSSPALPANDLTARFEAIGQASGCPMKRMKELALEGCKKELATLSEAECGKLRNIIAVDWAEITYGEYGVDSSTAVAYFKEFWQDCDRTLADAEFFRAWKTFLNLHVFSE